MHKHNPQTRDEVRDMIIEWVVDNTGEPATNFDIEALLDSQFVEVEGEGWFQKTWDGRPITDLDDMGAFDEIAAFESIEEHRIA